MKFQRSNRVADAIREEVSALLRRGLKDPRIGFVTITGVEVSGDLRNAKVFYSVVGDPAKRAESQKGLDSATPYVQGEVGRRLRIRNTPILEFRFDPSIERGARIEQLLKAAGAQPAAEASGYQLGAPPAREGAEPELRSGGADAGREPPAETASAPEPAADADDEALEEARREPR
jgi:ribosome-binding factor A